MCKRLKWQPQSTSTTTPTIERRTRFMVNKEIEALAYAKKAKNRKPPSSSEAS